MQNKKIIFRQELPATIKLDKITYLIHREFQQEPSLETVFGKHIQRAVSDGKPYSL